MSNCPNAVLRHEDMVLQCFGDEKISRVSNVLSAAFLAPFSRLRAAKSKIYVRRIGHLLSARRLGIPDSASKPSCLHWRSTDSPKTRRRSETKNRTGRACPIRPRNRLQISGTAKSGQVNKLCGKRRPLPAASKQDLRGRNHSPRHQPILIFADAPGSRRCGALPRSVVEAR